MLRVATTRSPGLRVSLGLLALWATGCGAPPAATPEAHALQGTGLGTTWNVKWMGSAGEAEVEAAVVEALSAVDASMSTWRDDSELARIRAAEGPVPVSWETAFVVEQGLMLARDSGGAFDPTVQPLVELWGFHGKVPDAVPTDDEVARVRAETGWEKVAVARTDAGPTVDSGGTALDLSAIAKGWAVDRVAFALSAEGVADYLVEVGGETRVAGQGSRGPWVVGVEKPTTAAPGTDLWTAVRPMQGAVASSGNYRRRVAIGGQTFGHTLDPRTGRPTDNPVRSATVIAPDCLTADGLATALMVLGEAGLALVEERPGVEAMLLVEAGSGFEERTTSGFADFRVQ